MSDHMDAGPMVRFSRTVCNVFSKSILSLIHDIASSSRFN